MATSITRAVDMAHGHVRVSPSYWPAQLDLEICGPPDGRRQGHVRFNRDQAKELQKAIEVGFEELPEQPAPVAAVADVAALLATLIVKLVRIEPATGRQLCRELGALVRLGDDEEEAAASVIERIADLVDRAQAIIERGGKTPK